MANRKGIIIASGEGTGHQPLSSAVSHYLLPIYDKPMIYYPLSVLMQAGITEVAVIAPTHHHDAFRSCLKDGHHLGLSITLLAPSVSDRNASACIVAEDFLAGAPSVLALGDNLLCGSGLAGRARTACERTGRATLFTCPVLDPREHGVVTFDAHGRATEVAESASRPRSDHAVTGLYFLDGTAPERARALASREYSFPALFQQYLIDGLLDVEQLSPCTSWFDASDPNVLLDASGFIRGQQTDHGVRIGCVEEIAFRRGFIDARGLLTLSELFADSAYGHRLRRVALSGRREDAPLGSLV